jgi:biopolymer transport protein ExbB/TolQ
MSLPLLASIHSALLAAPEAPIHMSFDLIHLWATMGFFAKFIVIVLAVMSVYSLGVMGERLVTYSRAIKASRTYAEELRQLLPARKLSDAISLAKQLHRGHLSRVLGGAIEEYNRGMTARTSHGPHDVGDFDVIAAVNRTIERTSMRTVADLRRGLGALATVGSTAPFVGLLGTVAGIITTFQAMAATGSGGLGAVSAGIAEALVATAFGLLVAIPAVMMFNYFTNRVEDMTVDISDSANELVDYFLKEGKLEVPSANIHAGRR